jgi:hypothetical protein
VRVMAFFRAPGVPWLYSGALMTNPSNEAISAAHCLVCSSWSWPIDRSSG